ncbi:MAG TPA: hypothetical protein VHC19_24740 [Pirellulales bacterium]|nr:hypothetical protein [Pirellulales bacterium]
MSRIVGPADYHGRGATGPVFSGGYLFRLVREAGVKGVLALISAAAAAFLPLIVLLWFNFFRFDTVPLTAISRNVQVKQEQTTDDAESEEPGETALLQIFCEVPNADGWRTLYAFDDPARNANEEIIPLFASHEAVYLRPRREMDLPFALLGLPPLSIWLPAGDYEILVVYRPCSDWNADRDATPMLPLAASRCDCTLEDGQRTVVRVPLPHHEEPLGIPLRDASGEQAASPERLAPFCRAIEQTTAVPTPGGVLLNLPEPTVRHQDEHRECTVHFDELAAVNREWTREQLAELRAWLPAEATATRNRLDELIRSLDWRAFFQGWYCYVAAGVSGLVLTRWGAISLLEPVNRRRALYESIRIAVAVFLLAAGAWFFWSLLTGAGGCRFGGALPKRPF